MREKYTIYFVFGWEHKKKIFTEYRISVYVVHFMFCSHCSNVSVQFSPMM
jgi:hypothetical protein